MTARELRIEVTGAPEADALECVSQGLIEFNRGDVGPSEKKVLAVFLRSGREKKVVGGLIGYTAWGWLYVQQLWLDEPFRGKGHAASLLNEAEAEAVRRGCKAAWLDTFNPHAFRAYQRQGYEVFGELPQFPAGRTRYFLRKELVALSGVG